MFGTVFPSKQQGNIEARRVELSGCSDRDGCHSHPRGPHTHTHYHSTFCSLLQTHTHTDECDLMCCSTCKWTPSFSSMKIYSWPEVDVGAQSAPLLRGAQPTSASYQHEAYLFKAEAKRWVGRVEREGQRFGLGLIQLPAPP